MRQEPAGMMLCSRYAKAFATYAKECQMDLTDVTINEDVLKSMVGKVLDGIRGAQSIALKIDSKVEETPGSKVEEPPANIAAPQQAEDQPDPIPKPVDEAPKPEKAPTSFKGAFTHPVFGTAEIPIEVVLMSSSRGQWTAEGQTEDINVKREGQSIL